MSLTPEWLLNAGFALSVGMLALRVMDGPDPAEDDSPATRAAQHPDVVRAAFLAGGCQRRHDRLRGRKGARAARRRRHHWRRYQRWLRVLQLRMHRRMRRWDPLEMTALMLLLSAGLGFALIMAMIVETSVH